MASGKERLRRARLQYYAESFRRKWAQWPTLVFAPAGGLRLKEATSGQK